MASGIVLSGILIALYVFKAVPSTLKFKLQSSKSHSKLPGWEPDSKFGNDESSLEESFVDDV